MPGQDQYVKLPDGGYVHIPSTATPDQLAQFHNKLASQYSDMKTGKGMQEKAQSQATPKPGVLPGQSQGPAPTGNSGTEKEPLVTPKPGESFADTMGRGAAMGRDVTTEQLSTARDEAIKRVPTVLGAASVPGMVTGLAEGASAGVPGLLKLGRGVIGAGAGGMLGAGAGERAGSLLGPTGSQVGGVLGGLGGMAVGGGMAAGLERSPTTMRIKSLPLGIQRAIPEWMVPGGVPEDEVARASFMNKGYKPAAIASRTSALAAPMEQAPVMHVREPLPTAPGEKPGSMYSVPREQLEGLAKTGKPGALDTLRDLGRKALIIPEGAGEYSGPRAKVAVPDDEPDDE